MTRRADENYIISDGKPTSSLLTKQLFELCLAMFIPANSGEDSTCIQDWITEANDQV
jgi:hypothetical protein